jgi:non-specific protein-tyrosine kinase
MITILTAAGIGFVLSASAAYLLEYLDDRIRTPEQIRRIADLPTLAGIAQIKGEDTRLVTMRRPRDPVSEAFRVLRTNIQFTNVDHPYRSLLMTSAMPLEGKSATISNLGVVLAQAGHNVLLIDADLRRPSQHEIFDAPNRRGLTDLLLAFEPSQPEGERSALLAELTHATQVDNLTLLPSGPPPPNPSELLGSDKMALLIEALSEQFDYLLFDSPPVLSVTDAAVLGTIVEGTVLVVRAGKSRKGMVERGVEQLRDVHANLIGSVLNGLPPNSEGFSAYYYYRDPYYNEVSDSDEGASGPSGEQKKTPKWRERFSGQERGEPDPIGQQ